MNFDDITFTQGKFGQINYTFSPVIDFDETSFNGVCRHISFVFIDGVLQFEEVFKFTIIDVSQTESNALQAIDGSNSVTFQPYDFTDVYTCNCSLYPFKYIQNSKELTSFNVTLNVRSVEIPPVVPDYEFYFPFNNGSLIDQSGNGNIITNNAATQTQGIEGDVNGAYSFDGITNYMNVNFQRLDYPEFTLTMWVKTDGSTSSVGIFQWADNLSSALPFHLIRYESGNVRFFYSSGYRYTTSLPLNEWVFISVRRSQTTGSWKFTVNDLFHTDLQGSTYGGASMYFANGFNGYMDMDLDNIRFYTRSLTDAEITLIYNDQG